MARVIGITGGIASGKSFVSNYLEKKGYAIIDADIVAREVVEKDTEGYFLLINAFGQVILDNKGNLSRNTLGKMVFSDKEKLTTLNQILHPLIEKVIQKKLEQLSNETVVFLVVPLFYETGYDKYTDRVWYITSKENSRIERIMTRDKIDKQLAWQKLKSQLSPDEVIAKYSPIVISNDGTKKDLEDKIESLLSDIKK